jgi:D-glycero-D-manno-heptose 1,7-bisphosphate phosphatase
MNKAVFLDRDGTVNIDKNFLYKVEDFEFTYKAVEALEILQKQGYKIVIVTNQSGVARGYYTEEDVDLLHEWLKKYLSDKGIHIDGIYYCPHHPDGVIEKYAMECNCRKPALGLYYRAIGELDIDTGASFAVGDNLRDLEICKRTNVKGILISEEDLGNRGGGTESHTSMNCKETLGEIHIVPNLYEAALQIVRYNELHSGVMNRS